MNTMDDVDALLQVYAKMLVAVKAKLHTMTRHPVSQYIAMRQHAKTCRTLCFVNSAVLCSYLTTDMLAANAAGFTAGDLGPHKARVTGM